MKPFPRAYRKRLLRVNNNRYNYADYYGFLKSLPDFKENYYKILAI